MTPQQEPWNHHWFGFWRDELGGDWLPQVEQFRTQSQECADAVLRYLQTAPVAIASAGGYRQCSLCRKMLIKQAFQTDYIWLWPCSLAHYVEQHGVDVPSEFLDHMKANSFAIPESRPRVVYRDLPWPRRPGTADRG